jgi:hypothetical protein
MRNQVTKQFISDEIRNKQFKTRNKKVEHHQQKSPKATTSTSIAQSPVTNKSKHIITQLPICPFTLLKKDKIKK